MVTTPEKKETKIISALLARSKAIEILSLLIAFYPLDRKR